MVLIGKIDIHDIQNVLYHSVGATEFLCALVASLYFKKVKGTYWKWFAIYVILIFILEVISIFGLDNYPEIRKFYYDFFVIPGEFLFLYWLYAYKSLQLKKLFVASCFIYLITLVAYLFFFKEPTLVFSITYVVGNLLLLIMVCLEFYNQVQTDKILQFKKNMMFYVNAGVVLFYIGTLPFFTFYGLILKDMAIWNNYYAFFMLVNNVMYLLFAAAFIWGEPNI
ncbi:MAG: hypothetical protein PSV16_09355 [Flavobacterium sp.]|nr:hypothetical protein [Flavobacterium sp.]